jgi:beta-lactamase superfamily II metal-dependent hydrolase
MQSESVLRQAVEEQLDLILKIEEERKLLKKENRVLKDEHQKMMNTLKKYHVERIDQAVATDPL